MRRLSPEARYFRFMHAVEELTPEMLVRFTQIDYSREMALIAVVEEGGKEKQIGVARYVINPDGESGEFAIVVSDERQKQGIGTSLMKGLMLSARYHGMKILEGAVLAENSGMLTLMRSLGFAIARDPEDESVCAVEHWL